MKDYRQEAEATLTKDEQVISLLTSIARHLKTIKIASIVIACMPVILWVGWQLLMMYITSKP